MPAEFYDPLKENVDRIENSTTIIDQNVKDIKNTDLANLDTKVDNIKVLSSRLPKMVYTIASHHTYVKLNVTGSGILVSCGYYGKTSGDYSVQIDGGEIYDFPYGMVVMLPFKTSLKIYESSGGAARISYLLD